MIMCAHLQIKSAKTKLSGQNVSGSIERKPSPIIQHSKWDDKCEYDVVSITNLSPTDNKPSLSDNKSSLSDNESSSGWVSLGDDGLPDPVVLHTQLDFCCGD